MTRLSFYRIALTRPGLEHVKLASGKTSVIVFDLRFCQKVVMCHVIFAVKSKKNALLSLSVEARATLFCTEHDI